MCIGRAGKKCACSQNIAIWAHLSDQKLERSSLQFLRGSKICEQHLHMHGGYTHIYEKDIILQWFLFLLLSSSAFFCMYPFSFCKWWRDSCKCMKVNLATIVTSRLKCNDRSVLRVALACKFVPLSMPSLFNVVPPFLYYFPVQPLGSLPHE